MQLFLQLASQFSLRSQLHREMLHAHFLSATCYATGLRCKLLKKLRRVTRPLMWSNHATLNNNNDTIIITITIIILLKLESLTLQSSIRKTRTASLLTSLSPEIQDSMKKKEKRLKVPGPEERERF